MKQLETNKERQWNSPSSKMKKGESRSLIFIRDATVEVRISCIWLVDVDQWQ